MKFWIYISAHLLTAVVFQLTEARPMITKVELSEEDVKSLVYRILESSKLSKALIKKDAGITYDDYPKEYSSTGAEKGAIVGGTVAAGIVLGVTIFVGVLIYKQCLIRRGRGDTMMPSRLKSPEPRAMPDGNSTRGSWRHTFNHQVSIQDSESVYSQRSFGNIPAAVRAEMAQARRLSPPPLPPKAAKVLGVDAAISTPSSMAPLPALPLPTTPLPPTQDPEPHNPPPPAIQERRSSRDPRARTSSNCTMSTLGMDLLHDVMQPISPTKFNPPAKTRKPPPVALNNIKGQKRMPSRRYFVPMFKKNGQLPSPTSPNDSAATETETETVIRDSSRANMFSLGDDKI
ncbi:hypothetical protein F66182_605 [Fusarium sp. NRRL 66182]|nr:hypothetical protein F66182_605 [Fusarium sp. NRRL 66182]